MAEAESKKSSKEDDMFEYTSAIQLATAAIRDAIEGTTKHTDEIKEEIKKRQEAREAVKKGIKAENEYRAAKNKTKDGFNYFIKFLNDVTTSGIKLSSTLGTVATKGVELELNNRVQSAKSVFTSGQLLLDWNANLMISTEQIQAAQQGFTDAFVGAREGFQVSSRGATDFAKNLKIGFKSEFTPTAETFRILTQMGMSTTAQFDAFRRATGRASLSNNQLATLYNKNQLSFLLYGNSFARAATNAEKLGVNLASVQAAQEGLVTNLDGTIDTVAQLNQLGADIDFGTLVRIAEQEGPDALMAYVRATVPEQLMQSTSTRALFKQLGISVEDYMKSGQKQQSAAAQLETQMTEAATAASDLAEVIGGLARGIQILSDTFGMLIKAAFVAWAGFRVLGYVGTRTAITSGITTFLGNLGIASSGIAAFSAALLPVLAVLAGIGLIMYGRKKVREGETGTGMAIGVGGGALLGAALGAKYGAGFGPWGIAIGALLGAGLGLVATGTETPDRMRTGGDVFSAPGKRTEIAREGSFVDRLNSTMSSRTMPPTKAPSVKISGDMLGIPNKMPRIRTMDDGISVPGAAVQPAAKGSLLSNATNLADTGVDTADIARTGFLAANRRARMLALLSKYKGLGIGNVLGGIIDGIQAYNESREKGKGVLESAGRGGVMGAATGGVGLGAGVLAASLMGTAGAAPLAVGLLASMAASYGTQYVANKMLGDDVLSTPAGYGERILLTPQGPIALNNKDTVMAFADDMVSGTTRLPYGYLAGIAGNVQANTASLTKKVDELISAISNASTVINIEGTTKTVPRIQLAGVYSRNER